MRVRGTCAVAVFTAYLFFLGPNTLVTSTLIAGIDVQQLVPFEQLQGNFVIQGQEQGTGAVSNVLLLISAPAPD
jgi:hypothetical protein